MSHVSTDKEINITESLQPEQDREMSNEKTAAEPQSMLDRYINLSSSLNFEVITQSGWETLAFTFQFALLNGGPASIVYGGILASFGASAVAMSLAEMASMDPTVGAQYRWSANFAPAAPKFWGLIQGWLTTAAWIFAAAVGPASLANIVSGLIIFNAEDAYEPKRWHITMIMWLFIIIAVVGNLWFRRLLNTMETVGGIIHFVFFFINIITLAVLAKPSTNEFVWKTLTHDISGWTNPGIAFGLGQITMSFPIAGADGLLHMCDEIKEVRTRVPISIITSTISNAIMMYAFGICLLYTIGDINQVTNTKTGLPLIEVYSLATESKAATNIFVIAIAVVTTIAIVNNYASVSRLVWAFARDNGLPFANVFSQINPTFNLPLNALLFVAFLAFCLSLIYIGSSTAYNAIVSLTSLAFHVSYFIPILFIALRKVRGTPLPYGPYSLGRWGIPVNVFSLAYLVFVIIWMPFPVILPITRDNMNYASPVFGIIVIGALVDWFVSGRRRFHVPVAKSAPTF